MANTHPMQPIYLDDVKVARFRENAIVRFLLDWATNRGIGMNELAMMPFHADDRQHFAQLIGYSVSGYRELSYSDEAIVSKADSIVNKLTTQHNR